MTDQTNDDLLNELNSVPNKTSKKKKKKGGETAPSQQPQTTTQAPSQETKEEDPSRTNDDLLNELDSMPKKSTKKKGKKKAEDTEPKASVPEDSTQSDPKAEPQQPEPKKEDDDTAAADQDKDKDDEDQKEAGAGAGGEAKPKKKKVIKKVVKKKDKGNDALIKLLQEKKKKEKEIEEQLIKEAEERERKKKEEEDKRKKEEEEQRIKEEEQKKLEEERLKHLKGLGIKSSEVAKLDENKRKTEEMLKQQGTDLNALLNSLKTQGPKPKKKKTKMKKEDAQNKIEDEGKGEGEEGEDKGKEDNVNDNKDNKGDKGEVIVEEEEANENKFVVAGNEDVDDWENEVDNEDQPKDIINNINANTNNNTNNDNGHFNDSNTKDDNNKASSSSSQSTTNAKDDSKSKGKKKTKIIEDDLEDKEPTGKLRSPIICILGHVDTGKTKILDKLRHSNVQIGEAGGITQQIGATFLPMENIQNHIKKLSEKFQIEPKVPGLLIIDTPGHASFQNLRSRGNSLCDLAVLVINITKGIEKQTLEALDLIRKKKTPFIIALNQIDRVYQWKSTEWAAFRESLDSQKKGQSKEFWELIKQCKINLIKNNFNTEIYDENQSMKEYVNLVPTSAITGEGMPDLIGLLVYLSQKYLSKKIQFKNEIQCTILEVKVLEGTGTTIDVILVNGTLKVGDKIIVGGLFGPIRTTVKIIYTPQPMREIRVKGEYLKHESISGSMGAKIFATDLDNALAGSPLYVYHTEEQAEEFAKEITRDFNSIVKDFLSKNDKGIMVQASTLGSLEAILTYLHEQKIAVSLVGVGNLNKKDVLKMQTMYSLQENPLKEDLVILSFDNKVVPEAQQFADANKIKIFNDDIIYHLFDSYTEFKNQCIAERKKAKEKEAIFPCVLKIVMFINKKDPLIVGVDVLEGIMKIGTPIYCADKKLPIGIIENIEKDHKPINNVKPVDGSVSIRIKVFDTSLSAGRHFDESSSFVSYISRKSIDALKEFFKDDMTPDDWKLVIRLKKILDIV